MEKLVTAVLLILSLFIPNPSNTSNSPEYEKPIIGALGSDIWSKEELREWSKWNYDDGFVIKKGLSKPWRQKRAGLPFGLSILVDANTDQYYCPASDSVGIRYILHTPLEMPHVMELSSALNMGNEILVEVHPEVTKADDDIRNIKQDKRMCYFGKEKNLRFFAPYTGANCIDECMTTFLQKKCKCSLFYLPRDIGIRICNSDSDSEDSECVESAKTYLQESLEELCSDCDSLCEDIAYKYETTIASLQNAENLWGDPDPTTLNKPPEWMDHKMSIVHIFFGADSVVPKSRKRLYGTTDLIANTGGILGLCLGFSILSGIEVLYFLMMRPIWKYCVKRWLRRKQRKEQEELNRDNFSPRILFQKRDSKITPIEETGSQQYPYNLKTWYW